MSLQAMTREKLQFLLPVVFSIGPDVNHRGSNARNLQINKYSASGENGQGEDVEGGEGSDHVHIPRHTSHSEDHDDALMKYVMLLADDTVKKGGLHTHVENIIKGIIEGETRVLVSAMTMEYVFFFKLD